MDETGNVTQDLTPEPVIYPTVPYVPPVTKAEPKPEFRNEFEVGEMLKTAGKVALSDKEKEILYAPVNELDVEIRPDGLIYLPWMEYVTRLRNAFGMEWSIIPQGMPKLNQNLIRWGFWLVVRGSLMGYAIGEQEYHPENATMGHTDACEGAKSNALMRLCKGVGISLELWKPSFIREWKKRYAEVYTDNRGKSRWRKKVVSQGGEVPQKPTAETAPVKETPTDNTPFRVDAKKVFQLLMEIYSDSVPVVRAVLENQTKKSSFKELSQDELDVMYISISQMQSRLKEGCNGRPEENGCGHCSIHYDSSYNWCSFDSTTTEDDFICPVKKGGI